MRRAMHWYSQRHAAGSKDAKEMDDRSTNPTIEEVPKDAMRLTLHISRVRF
jgi:hypothetical protein